jgi:hypothetical protein
MGRFSVATFAEGCASGCTGTLSSGDVLDAGYDRRFADERCTEVIG